MMTADKKRRRTASFGGRRREDKAFKEYLIRIATETIPGDFSEKEVEYWRSKEGNAELYRRIQELFEGLKRSGGPTAIISSDQAEEIMLATEQSIELQVQEEPVGDGTYGSRQEQTAFLDPGQADEVSWPAGKEADESAADESPDYLRTPKIETADSAAVHSVAGEGVLGNIQTEEEVPAPSISDVGLEEQFQAALKEWIDFYLSLFLPEIEEEVVCIDDIVSLKCPERVSGLLQLIVVAKGLTPVMLYKKCMKFFPCRSKRKDDWQFIWNITSSRNSEKESYATWTDRRLNADKKFSGYSPATLRAAGVKTLNFEERCLHDLWRMYKDLQRKGVAVEEYDIKQFHTIAGDGFMYEDMTLCPDSTVNDPSKCPGNAVVYAWHGGAFAVWVWEPRKWEAYQDKTKKSVLEQLKRGDNKEESLKKALRELEQRYFRDTHARQVSVDT